MSNGVASVVNGLGRVMLAAIFLMSAVGNKIPRFGQTVEYMAANGVPAPQLMLVGAILFLIAGSVALILGFQARIGAILLLIFLALATWYFHDFWTFAPDSPEYQQQMIQFLKNMGLAGGMLIVLANGAGPGSIDRWLHDRAKHSATGSSVGRADG